MKRPPKPRSGRRAQRGAALLVAMIILTLVTTLAASMVWQQYRAIQVETAERARQQSAWILTGALDWARLILREDLRSSGSPPVDHLGEPWAVPLAEARLSTFLAADQNNNADDGSGPDAFLSGAIEDAQSRYNLMNVVGDDGKPVVEEVKALERLCENANVSASTAQRLVEGLASSFSGSADGPVPPQTVEDLAWLGLDPADLKRLLPFVTLLPRAARTINVNTAPKEVIAAVAGVDLASAERLVQSRQREPFKDMENARRLLPELTAQALQHLGVSTSYFEVRGQVRLGDRVLQERSLVQRKDPNNIDVLWRRRVNLYAGGP